MNIEKRIEIERAIVTKVVMDAIEQGYSLTLNNGGDTDEIIQCKDADTFIKELFATDEEHIKFYDKYGKYVGFVYLVYGNDGYDVICDCSVTKEVKEIIRGAEALANEYESEIAHG